MHKVQILPSLLSANFANLEHDIRLVEKAGIEMLHLDIMDGHFVPNITIGPVVIESIRKITKLKLQSHLMIENADQYIDAFVRAGSDTIIIHYEAFEDTIPTLEAMRKKGISVGIALKPKTEVSQITDILNVLDMVLIMSVEPGFGGQSFIPESIKKIKELALLLKKYNRQIPIGVDGGINGTTIKSVVDAGAHHLIAGNAVFKGDIVENIKNLKHVVNL